MPFGGHTLTLCPLCGKLMIRRKSPGKKHYRIIKVLEACDYRCVFCGRKTGLTLDHITARADGGTWAYDNLRILCSTCNNDRGTGPG